MKRTIKYTKNGQPYIIKKDGRAQFIKAKRRTAAKSRKITRGYTMARRAKKSYSSRSKSYGIVGTVAAAAAYGAFRNQLSNALKPLTDKIPMGNVSDEIGLGIAAIVAKKYLGKKMPMVAKIADAALVIESARLGEAAISGQLGGITATSSSNVINY